MKFGIMFANIGPFSFPEPLIQLAQTAEEVGIESIWTVEHVVVPVTYGSKYPYSKSGRMPGGDNMPVPDPILPLAFAAAVTKKLRLATGVIILPLRHPMYLAKEMATLDVLSGGRAMLGIGSGWLKEEFAVVGVPFNQRGARTDETLRAIRSLWRETPESFTGRFFNWDPVESNPKPIQEGGVPIVVGGHSDAAARRAARHGDGFFPARGDPATLTHLLGVMRAECAKVGRNPESIEISTGAGKLDHDVIRRYEDMGVSRLIISAPPTAEDGWQRALHDFGNSFIAKQ